MHFEDQCKEKILSEEYKDIIVGEYLSPKTEGQVFSDFCYQKVYGKVGIIYIEGKSSPELLSGEYFYENIPKLYTPLSLSALEASGILKTEENPALNLRGQGVIMAVADTGIDYMHKAFLDSNGKTRILSIWDQTMQTGNIPEGFLYGSEFTSEDINKALENQNPLSIVPSDDTNGHGTYITGVAAGSRQTIAGSVYTGAAPLCDIAFVKLKPAKKYLKDHYGIREDALVYEENDIMLAVRYFVNLQKKYNKPVVICIALGNNLGGHDGRSPLSKYLNQLMTKEAICVVCAAGNEAARSHHYYGKILQEEKPDIVEVQIAKGENALYMEVWPDPSELVTIAVISPSGQRTEKFNTRLGVSNRIEFVLDGTVLNVNFWLSPSGNGNQIISVRMEKPAEGIWKILVYSVLYYNGGFNIWLPCDELIDKNTIFLKPDTNITLTEPSSGPYVVASAGYNSSTGAVYIQSGRGYNRVNDIQPTVSAPCVNIDGPSIMGVTGYINMTGTSAGAAITAGAAASIMTWGIVEEKLKAMTGTTVKFFLITGAVRENGRSYPNRELGYGKLNLYQFFEVLQKFY